MLTTLIIILILIGAAVVGSIYSNFLVFYSNFGESENYHRAYYASVSALERGELVIKQREPGYEGSGGFIRGEGTGSINNMDGNSDKSLSGFSYLGDRQDESTVFRTVKSRTTRIPSEGNGDVEDMLAYKDSSDPAKNSNNYNMMDYEDAEVFLLCNDDLAGNPYTGGSVVRAVVHAITGEIRLPALLTGFGQLDLTKSLISLSNALPPNDAIVDWQIRGQTDDWIPFTLYSTPSISFPPPYVNMSQDSVFRESDINGGLKFEFGRYGSPLVSRGDGSRNVAPTIISQNESAIEGIIIGGSSHVYENIFQHTKAQLRFGLLNLVEGYDGTTGHIYPFLEYYADFGAEVPDKYFTIDAEGSFKDYQVNTIVQKPTTKESILGNFTSIF